MNVLIVENNDANRLLLENTAGFIGLSVDSAKDAGGALRQRTQKQYDLILLSMTLPDFDSYSTAQALRQLERSEPGGRAALICGLTGNSEGQVIVDSMDHGMDCYMATPVTTGQAIDLLVRMRIDTLSSRTTQVSLAPGSMRGTEP